MPIEDIGDAINDWKRGSKHIRTRRQAIAVGLKAERERGTRGKRKTRKRRKARKGRRRRSDR